jgi:hypothetical protein
MRSRGTFAEAVYRIVDWELSCRTRFIPPAKFLGPGAFQKLHSIVEKQRPGWAHISARLLQVSQLRNRYGPHLKLIEPEPEYADHSISVAKVLLHDTLLALCVSGERAREVVSRAAKTGAGAAAAVIKKLQPTLLGAPQREWFEHYCVLLDRQFFEHYRKKSSPPVLTCPTVAWTHVVNGSVIQRPIFSDLLNLCRGREEATQALLLVIEGGIQWLRFTPDEGFALVARWPQALEDQRNRCTEIH